MLPEAVTPRESWADERAGVALMRQRSETHIHGTGSGSGLVGDTGARCSRRWRKREVWTAWPSRMWPSVSGAYPGHLRRLRPAHRSSAQAGRPVLLSPSCRNWTVLSASKQASLSWAQLVSCLCVIRRCSR